MLHSPKAGLVSITIEQPRVPRNAGLLCLRAGCLRPSCSAALSACRASDGAASSALCTQHRFLLARLLSFLQQAVERSNQHAGTCKLTTARCVCLPGHSGYYSGDDGEVCGRRGECRLPAAIPSSIASRAFFLLFGMERRRHGAGRRVGLGVLQESVHVCKQRHQDQPRAGMQQCAKVHHP